MGGGAGSREALPVQPVGLLVSRSQCILETLSVGFMKSSLGIVLSTSCEYRRVNAISLEALKKND